MKAWARLRRLLRSEERSAIERELSFHLEMREQELIDRGMPPTAAREEARRRFGSYDDSRRECVEIDGRRRTHMRRTQYWSELLQDLGYAFRMHRRNPGFTAVAVITLALGIGANSAIFSVVHGVLLQSLPYKDPDRLYRIRTLYPDGTPYTLSAPDFVSLRQDTHVFDQIVGYSGSTLSMAGAGEPREVRATGVTDGLFDLMGFGVTDGRLFQRQDNDPGQGTIAILDHGFAVREFGGDRGVVGRAISLGGRPYQIVGVLRPGERLPTPADLYTPIEYDATFQATDQPARRGEFLAVLGRAKSGVDGGAVGADLARVGTALQTSFPNTNANLTFMSTPLRDLIVGDVQKPLFMLLGAVGFVLLVACANVASLLLARASARQAEMAVRAALGAGKRRLLRQLVTESLVLALAGAAVGLGLAYFGTKALIAARPADIPRLDQISLNWTVVLVTLGIALVTGLLFGLFPAFQATGRGLTQSIRESGRGGGATRGGNRVRAGLVVVEMALAVVLLMGAGLLIRSFVELTRVPRGFETERGLTFNVLLQGPRYQGAAQIRPRVTEIEERLRRLPGVTAAAASTAVPLGTRGAMVDFAVADAPPPPANVNAEIEIASVTPDFFRAIGTPLKLGRGITDQDTPTTPPVALISEAGVRRWFDGNNPVGKFVTAAGGVRREIVGVVGDIPQRDLSQPPVPHLYTPFSQRASRTPRFVVRLAAQGAPDESTIRAALRELDRDVAITAFVPFTQLVAESVARPRFYTSLLALFAAAALILAATGIFGVMSYSVAQRSREISIRMALGARRGQVVSMIVGRAVLLAVLGITLGVVATLALAKTIQSMLFGVAVLDPITLTGVVLVLGLSAAAASFLPARRAAWIDPGSVLKQG